MAYQVKVPVFEGPLDLLLHLIDKNEVDIYDIPIALITQQYLDYMALAGEVDLELTSEFLLMACTLLAIKARMLLPKHSASADEEDPEDPRRELIEKILEYKLYKEKANEFKKMENDQAKVYWREIDETRLWKDFLPDNPLADISMKDLLQAYHQILRKIEKKREVVAITREEITVQEKMGEIVEQLREKPSGLSFSGLFCGKTDRVEVIVTFLALLELARRNLIILRQNKLFSNIRIYLKEGEGGQDSAHSVS